MVTREYRHIWSHICSLDTSTSVGGYPQPHVMTCQSLAATLRPHEGYGMYGETERHTHTGGRKQGGKQMMRNEETGRREICERM